MKPGRGATASRPACKSANRPKACPKMQKRYAKFSMVRGDPG